MVREIQVTPGDLSLLIKSIVESGIDFSAIIAFSDMIARETVYALDRLDYKVPQYVAVVGFDNIQSKLMFPILLTTISSSKSQMSRRDVELLLKK